MSNEQVSVTPVEPVVQMPPYGMTWREWFEHKAKLAKKKSAVMAAVATIPKNGYNEEHGYAFAKDADINDGLRQLLHDNNLDFDVEFLDRVYRDNGRIIEVKLLMTWIDCETGYFESRKWLATGFDTVDKGVYKAYTGGAKYYLMRTFLMSQGDTDPEYTSRRGQQAPAGNVDPDNLPSRQVDEDPKQTDTTRQTGGKGGGSRKPADKPKDEPKDKPADKPEDKPADKPADGQQEAASASQDPKQTEGAGSPEGAAEGQTGAAGGDPAGPGKVTAEQVGKIKQHVLTLAAFSDDKNKRAAQEAVYQSLTIKQELREWGQRVKGAKDSGTMIEALTEQEAEKAIEYLAAWVEMKQKAKGGRANA